VKKLTFCHGNQNPARDSNRIPYFSIASHVLALTSSKRVYVQNVFSCVLRCVVLSCNTFCCISIVKPTRCINVSNLFYWSNNLHVSDGLSVHHQELKTVRTTTGMCQTDTADCLICLTYACCSMYSL